MSLSHAASASYACTRPTRQTRPLAASRVRVNAAAGWIHIAKNPKRLHHPRDIRYTEVNHDMMQM